MLKAISTITNALGALNYKGTWNASSNTPTLADGTGAKGDYYVVSTAGTQTFGGVQLFFGTGDWIAYNGTVWQRVEGGSDGNFANVTLTSTDAGATASPLLELYRDSASPAASDTLGEIEFNGEDSAGNKQAYGLIHASILSPTSTSEQGQLHFETATAGALTEKMIIGTSNLVINEIGAVFNVRIEGDTDANLFYTDATNSRVGIGTASPADKFEVNGAASASRFIPTGSTVPSLGIYSQGANTLSFATNSTLRAYLDSNGAFWINGDNGYTSGLKLSVVGATGDGTFLFKNDAGGNQWLGWMWNSATSGDNLFINFMTEGGGTGRGSITYNRGGGLLAFNTTSDYRSKDIIGVVENSGEVIDALKIYMGKIKGATIQRPMLIAHEAQEFAPYSVTGEKDAVDEKGNPVFQQMDHQSFVPLILAELQSLRARVKELENK